MIHHEGNYLVNNVMIKVVLNTGQKGTIINFDSKNDYANIKFEDDDYAKSVPLEDILNIYISKEEV